MLIYYHFNIFLIFQKPYIFQHSLQSNKDSDSENLNFQNCFLTILLFSHKICYILKHHKAQLYYFLIMRFLASLILVALFVPFIICEDCGGNCPSGNCPTCPCGKVKSMQSIDSWCSQYTWNQACCRCIVSHQSGGNANAATHNEELDSYNVGLWQINTTMWSKCNGKAPPCNCYSNLNCAMQVYKGNNNSWKDWPSSIPCGCK